MNTLHTNTPHKNMKFCTNCKYFQPNLQWSTPQNKLLYGLCTHPTSITSISHHTGIVEYREAQERRKDPRGCGISARFFLDKTDIEPPKTPNAVYCTNCKYQRLNTTFHNKASQVEYAFCTHPLAIPDDVVTGSHPYTQDMRYTKKQSNLSETMGTCGVNGYMYEEKTFLPEHTKTNTEKNDAFKRKLIAIALMILWFILMLLIKQ